MDKCILCKKPLVRTMKRNFNVCTNCGSKCVYNLLKEGYTITKVKKDTNQGDGE